MSLFALAFAGLACAALPREPLTLAPASDPAAVYALVDRAELDAAARTLVLHGAFLVGVGRYGDQRRSAERGTLHLRGSAAHAALHDKVLREIAATAGKDLVCTFGTRRDGATYVVGRADAPRWVDLPGELQVYALEDVQHYGPPVHLRSYPRAIAVDFAAQPGYQGAHFVDIAVEVGPERHPSLHYVITIERADGQRTASAALPIQGDGKVHWKDYFLFDSEERVRVSAHALHERLVSASVFSATVSAPKRAAEEGAGGR
ncbi:MAG: hypothetical protein JNM84_17565 [Planctomycetes bacterium]|nr:hypothetical protein [Planctomycetota bacterium]